MEELFFGLISDLLKISQSNSQKSLGLNLNKEACRGHNYNNQ